MSKRVAHDFRLLVNFFGHEVLVVALVDQLRRGRRLDDRTLNFVALLVPDFCAFPRENDPIAVFQVADGVSEWSKRDRIGTKKHFTVTVTDGKWRTFTRSNQQIVFSAEQKGERERAPQLLE
jgi:hypothetical protein